MRFLAWGWPIRFPTPTRSGRSATADAAGAVERLLGRFDEALRAAGYLAMGGQIVDATIVSAPKQRNTEEEKAAIREGRIPEGWQSRPAKLAQKDRDARWTLKTTKAKPSGGESKRIDLAIPAFGYKNHIAIDRRHGLIRQWTVSHAAAHDGARLEAVLDKRNMAAQVWADTAYRSAKNEAMLARRGFVSQIHRKKPKGKPMPRHIAQGNATKSKVRAAVENVFAHEKGIMGLFVRTVGIARARVKIGLAILPTTCAHRDRPRSFRYAGQAEQILPRTVRRTKRPKSNVKKIRLLEVSTPC